MQHNTEMTQRKEQFKKKLDQARHISNLINSLRVSDAYMHQ